MSKLSYIKYNTKYFPKITSTCISSVEILKCVYKVNYIVLDFVKFSKILKKFLNFQNFT